MATKHTDTLPLRPGLSPIAQDLLRLFPPATRHGVWMAEDGSHELTWAVLDRRLHTRRSIRSTLRALILLREPAHGQRWRGAPYITVRGTVGAVRATKRVGFLDERANDAEPSRSGRLRRADYSGTPRGRD